jgi:acetyltransferase-like isoleucine patch superfamily enzyme
MKPLYIVLALLPNFLKIAIYNTFLNCSIHKTAYIGLSYLQAEKIIMGPNSRIGHFNIVKNLDIIEINDSAAIGNFNEFMAIPRRNQKHFIKDPNRLAALKLGKHAAIVKNHFFDCNNTIMIGDYTLVAGIGSVFFTHGIDISANEQQSAPITIGKYCLISTRCTFVKGSVLPNYSVLAANSTLHKPFTDEYMLYSGVPAKSIKQFPKDALFFNRNTGYVS